MTGAAKRIVLETLGWVLLLVGIAALVLPGPGLLCIFAALALLSQQYEWADRRVDPIRLRALRGAAEGVATWPRIVASVVGAVALAACGVLWILDPAPPAWWPLDAVWWLPGGLWTGITQLGSAVIAIALILYSYRRYHGNPDALAELDREISERKARKGADGDSDEGADSRPQGSVR